MKKKGLLGLVFGMCLVLSLMLMTHGTVATGADIILKVGTGPVGGNWFPLGAVVCTIINEKVEGVRAAPTLGGGKSNLIALNKGTQDFSLTIATTNAWGWNGEPPFKQKWRNARAVFNTYINVIHGYAPGHTGIKEVADLKGKRVSLGPKGFTGRVIWELTIKEYGIETKGFYRDGYQGYSEGARMLKDRQLDAYLLCTLPPSAPFLEVDTFAPVNLIIPSPDIQKRMIEKYPGIGPCIIEGGIYKQYPEKVKTIGFPCVFATRKDLPEDVIYRITKAFWENHQRTWKVNPNFEPQIKPENAIAGMALPLHKGAYKYYKEKGYTIPDKIKAID